MFNAPVVFYIDSWSTHETTFGLKNIRRLSQVNKSYFIIELKLSELIHCHLCNTIKPINWVNVCDIDSKDNHAFNLLGQVIQP